MREIPKIDSQGSKDNVIALNLNAIANLKPYTEFKTNFCER